MKIAIGIRLQGFTAPGSIGVVTDTLFINCYWPKLDRPTRLFADGSSGIRVLGTTPRNVWFPDDTVFEAYYPDALYPAEQAVLKAFPFNRRGLVNLSPAEAQVWLDAYTAAVAKFPLTHSVFETPRSCNFLRHREVKSERSVTLKEDSVTTLPDGSQSVISAGSVIIKRDYEEYVAELTADECLSLVDGKVDESVLREAKTFVKVADPSVVLVKAVA